MSSAARRIRAAQPSMRATISVTCSRVTGTPSRSNRAAASSSSNARSSSRSSAIRPGEPQLRQRPRRVAAGRHDQRESGHGPVDQAQQAGVHQRGGHFVQVVEDQDDAPFRLLEA
jgi:hypothetical protein